MLNELFECGAGKNLKDTVSQIIFSDTKREEKEEENESQQAD